MRGYQLFRFIILCGALAPLAFWLYYLLVEYREGFVILRENRLVLLIEIVFVVVWLVSFITILIVDFFILGEKAVSHETTESFNQKAVDKGSWALPRFRVQAASLPNSEPFGIRTLSPK